MRRLVIPVLAAVLLLGLCACGQEPVGESAAFTAETAAPAAEASAAPAEEAALTPGASETAYRSYRFQQGADGGLYTCLARGEGLTCLYDLLPADIGYIARFAVTEDGIYATVKDAYFSLEPAALYLFPADGGEARLLASELSSIGDFVLTDGELFCPDYDNRVLWRLDPAGGVSEQALTAESLTLLDADGGFIYYARDGGVYRNDSTMRAEVPLFAPAVSYLYAENGRVADLAFYDGASRLELREPDGSLITSVRLDETTDNFLCADGRIYVPQPDAKEALIFDMQSGEYLGVVPLPSFSAYSLLLHAAGDTVWYQTYADGETVLCRADAQGEEILGPVIQ